MKMLLAFLGVVAIVVQAQVEVSPKDDATATGIVAQGTNQLQGPFIRNLPADTLRDFPGVCFASTLCRVFKHGEEWSLQPFCGKATCLFIKESNVFVERVQDCGPLPKPNPNCKISNKASRNETFPACCPQFECVEGATLDYPTLEELAAASRIRN